MTHIEEFNRPFSVGILVPIIHLFSGIRAIFSQLKTETFMNEHREASSQNQNLYLGLRVARKFSK